MKRRALIAMAPLMAIVACSGAGSTVNVSQIAADAAAISGGLAGATNAIGTLVKIPPGTQVQIEQALTDIQAASASIAQQNSAAGAQPYVRALVQATNALVAAAAVIPGIPPQYQAVFAAASALLPAIEAAAGIAAGSGAAAPMTPEEARLVLRGAALQGRAVP